MSEMVDRVARAIKTRFDDRADGVMIMDFARDLAEVAIAAMREPTLAMFEAGDFQTPSFSEGDPERATRVWRAMVDEALR